MVFLCGSLYNSSSNSDKRKVLNKYLSEKFENKLYCLIIDEFLNTDSIEDDSFSIKKMEEIISSISFLNFIFLESFSSASELGLFSNIFAKSRNVVLYPDSTNLIHDKLGYFVKEGILNKEVNSNISSKSYHARVERFAHGTDYVDEHYYFPKDCLPNEIEAFVDKEVNETINKEYDLKIISNLQCSHLDFMTFNVVENCVYISLKTFFYTLYVIFMKKVAFKKVHLYIIDKPKVDDFINEITNLVKDTIKVYEHKIYNDNLELVIEQFDNIVEATRYCLNFIKYFTVFTTSSEFKFGRNGVICKWNDLIEKDKKYQNKEKEILNLSTMCRKLTAKKKAFVKKEIKTGKKIRSITTYSEDFKDYREAHYKFNEQLRVFAKENDLCSPNSYAYKKNLNTLKCVLKHAKSKCFLKTDIKSFFDSMKPSYLKDKIYNKYINNKKNIFFNEQEIIKLKHRINMAFGKLTYYGKFPIGFITSPIISEMYLSDFDKQITAYCDSIGVIYTRYADDMLFSSEKQFEFDTVLSFITGKLKQIGLKLNDKKISKKSFSKNGDYLNFVGMFFIYKNGETKISLGKAFVKKAARLKVYGDKNKKYILNKIQGVENYLKYNDPKGFELYNKIISIYLNNRK